METKFLNSEHQKLYDDARRMLDNEIQRETEEMARLMPDIEKCPPDVQQERMNWLRQHFDACRKPYMKILTDVLALCPVVYILPPDEAQNVAPPQS